MSEEIGLGLLLNVLLWAAGLCLVVAAGVAVFADFFPGRARKGRRGARARRENRLSAGASPGTEQREERYRKAS